VLKTKKQAEALSNLRSNADFDVVLGMLSEYRAEQLEKLAKTVGEPSLYRLQGAIHAVVEIQAAYASAPDMIHKLK
jgi:hypothetical protein